MSFLGRIGVLACLVGPSLLGCASQADAHEECSRRISELEGQIVLLRKQVEVLLQRLELVSQPFHYVDPALPRIDAYVLEVKPDLKLVVLNKGKKDGVKEGYTFTIYRGSKFKGQARVQDVQESMCSALITGEKTPIERGDSASTKL